MVWPVRSGVLLLKSEESRTGRASRVTDLVFTIVSLLRLWVEVH
jgi:hypothetical protein